MSKIRDLRHAIAVLKKRGLISGRTKAGFPIDARSIQPGTLINGKRADKLAAKYDDVVSGKVTPLKVPPEKLRIYRKQGFETSQGRVLVPHSAGQTAFVSKGAIGTRERATGITRLVLPIEFHNIPQYLNDIKKNRAAINRMKQNNEWFGIRFFGNHRANFYRDILALQADLQAYDTLGNPPRSKSKQLEIFNALEILKISPKAAPRWEDSATAKYQKMSAEYNRRRASRQRKKLKKAPHHIQEQYRQKQNDRMKAYRKRLAKSPGKLKQYRAAAKKRAKKSQRKKKR